MVGSDGLEPSMTEVGRFTVSCNSRYANYPLKLSSLSQCHTTDPTQRKHQVLCQIKSGGMEPPAGVARLKSHSDLVAFSTHGG